MVGDHFQSRSLSETSCQLWTERWSHIGYREEVNAEIDQLTQDQRKNCCTLEDYQRFLRNLKLSDGKVALIIGKPGIATSRSSKILFSEPQLRSFSEKAIQARDGFVVIDISTNETVAVKEIKLPGGPESGNFVYVRPIYGIPLLKSQSMIKLVIELILVLFTCLLLVVSARRPLRAIKKNLSLIELSTINGATLPTDNAPVELLPLLKEFNRMVERLRNSSANQKQFAATVSHEFRTPLTIISGFIQSVMYREKDTLKAQHLEALRSADEEVLRLNRMLSDLLDLSRSDNQQLTIRRESFELIPKLRQALNLAQHAYTNPIINNLDIIPNLHVMGDPDRLVQCIGNLISNAVKYSDTDSPIFLTVTHTESEVTVNIQDHGQGIPADQIERIFQRYTRAEGVIVPAGQNSTGLGLAIVKMLIEAMGGTVNVSSSRGNGSCFSLQLPLEHQRSLKTNITE